jgi:hypothetical protein
VAVGDFSGWIVVGPHGIADRCYLLDQASISATISNPVSSGGPVGGS